MAPLVAAYNFETLTEDSVGTNTLTNTGTVTQGGGVEGKAMVGGSGRSLSSAVPAIPFGLTTPVTHSFWFMLTANPAVVLSMAFADSSTDIEHRFGYVYSTTKYLRYYVAGGGRTAMADYTITLVNNRWYHIACVFASSGGYPAQMYCDGVYRAQASSPGYTGGIAARLVMGNDTAGGTSYPLAGRVDSMRIGNEAWSAASIKNEYARGRGFF